MRPTLPAFAWPALLCGLLFAAAPATASLPGIVLDPVDRSSAATQATAADTVHCLLLNGDPWTLALGFTLPDVYRSIAVRLPSGCPSCPSPSAQFFEHVQIEVQWWGSCNVIVEATLVGVTGPEDCRRPDLGRVLRGPWLQAIASVGDVAQVHMIPLFPEAAVAEEAFLVLQFQNLEDCVFVNRTPALVLAAGPCTNCDQYFTTSVAVVDPLNYCEISDKPFWVRVQSRCVTTTPVLSRSWGALKTIYR